MVQQCYGVLARAALCCALLALWSCHERRASDDPGIAQNQFSLRELPDPNLTPGAVLDVTAEDVCASGYTKTVRSVPKILRGVVLDRYRVGSVQEGGFELDHLISLELGGSNSSKNLWPEPYLTLWNAHVKDALENRLHRRVCSGDLDLRSAQQAIAADWIADYKHEFHTDVPKSRRIHRRTEF
jgi:hypothetical protein